MKNNKKWLDEIIILALFLAALYLVTSFFAVAFNKDLLAIKKEIAADVSSSTWDKFEGVENRGIYCFDKNNYEALLLQAPDNNTRRIGKYILYYIVCPHNNKCFELGPCSRARLIKKEIKPQVFAKKKEIIFEMLYPYLTYDARLKTPDISASKILATKLFTGIEWISAWPVSTRGNKHSIYFNGRLYKADNKKLLVSFEFENPADVSVEYFKKIFWLPAIIPHEDTNITILSLDINPKN